MTGGILDMMYFAADLISGKSVLALMLMPSSSFKMPCFALAGTFARKTSMPNSFLSRSSDSSPKMKKAPCCARIL